MKSVKIHRYDIEWNVRKRSVENHGSIRYYGGQYIAESTEIIIVYDRVALASTQVMFCVARSPVGRTNKYFTRSLTAHYSYTRINTTTNVIYRYFFGTSNALRTCSLRALITRLATSKL